MVLFNNCEDIFFYGCYYVNSYEQLCSIKVIYFYSIFDVIKMVLLIFGLRYMRDIIEIDNYFLWYGEVENSYYQESDGFILGSLGLDNESDEIDDVNILGKLGVDWKIVDNLLVYGVYSIGY